MGCTDGAPHKCSRVNEQRSGWGRVVTGLHPLERCVLKDGWPLLFSRRKAAVRRNLPDRA